VTAFYTGLRVPHANVSPDAGILLKACPIHPTLDDFQAADADVSPLSAKKTPLMEVNLCWICAGVLFLAPAQVHDHPHVTGAGNSGLTAKC